MSDNDKYQGFDSMPEDTDAVDTETADTPGFDTAAMREPSEHLGLMSMKPAQNLR
jgi:hypothetical protein